MTTRSYTRYRRTCTRCGATFFDDRLRKPGRFCSRTCANQRSFDDNFKARTCRVGACLEWQGVKNRDGYALYAGRFVHRIVWTKKHGAIPSGKVIRHRCHNPACVRLGHLRVGTQADNVRDRDRAGRTARGDRQGLRKHPEAVLRGSRNAIAKLTEKNVAHIKHSTAPGAVLARRFRVSPSTIHLIRKNKTWKHVK